MPSVQKEGPAGKVRGGRPELMDGRAAQVSKDPTWMGLLKEGAGHHAGGPSIHTTLSTLPCAQEWGEG
jgi:hypothetical protein